MATRAGKICFGADSVEMEIKKNKLKLVVIAQDSSDRTKHKFKKLCDDYDIPYIITETIENLSKAIGKLNKAIIGVKEANIAKQIQKINNGGDNIG